MADRLTDAQLVEELQRFGEPVSLPIDRKKRNILLKKLNHLKAREKPPVQTRAKPTGRRRRAAEFSSDESDTENGAGEAGAGSSKSFGRLLNRVSAGEAKVKSNTSKTHNDSFVTNALSRPGVRGRQPVASSLDDIDRPSPRLYPELNANPSTSRTTTPPRSGGRGVTTRRQTNLRVPKTWATKAEPQENEFSDSDLDESTYEVVNQSINTTFTIENGLDDQPSTDRVSSKTNTPTRQRQSRGTPRLQVYTTPNSTSRLNHNSSANRLLSEEQLRKQGFKTREDTKKSKFSLDQHVSMGILVTVGIFFAILALTYICLRTDLVMSNTDLQEEKTNYMICGKNEKPSEGCYDREEVMEALPILHTIMDHLANFAGEVEAGYKLPEKRKSLTKDQLQRQIGGLSSLKNKTKAEKLLNICIDLALHNPQWDIRVLTDEEAVATDLTQAGCLEAAVPNLPLLFRFRRSFYQILLAISVLLLCIAFIAVGMVYLRWRKKSKEEMQRRVFQMVEEIIDILQDHCERSQQDKDHKPYLAIQHVRDQLLPVSKRWQLQPIWDKAVKFIEANESRIRMETQTIEGEDYIVWRWLQSSANGGKVWQGQAFSENNQTLTYGPTPCLKIRNMFDADVEVDDEDWEISVQDAILEKCKNVNGIVHILVDKTSREGCVYMKCNSCEMAFKAYKSLHGWWFDGRLVTVKYLRIEHYHDRFPASRNITKPMMPSTNKMLSLSQPFHRSSLEMT